MLRTPAEIIKAASGRTNCLCVEEAVAIFSGSGTALLIDVREPEEVAQARLKGAINIPRGVLEMKIGEFCADADTPIFIHCATGGRAVLSAIALQEMGYRNLHVIAAHFDEISLCFQSEP